MTAQNRADPPVNLQAIRPLLHQDGRQTTGSFNGLSIRSHFQSIFSVAHSRTVGCEGLMRAADVDGNPVSPLDAFKLVRDFSHTLTVDRLSSAIHAHNFLQLGTEGWLFLNMN